MEKKTKLSLAGITLVLSAALLTGCTNSFCSVKDQANILYAFDAGVSQYFSSQIEAQNYADSKEYVPGSYEIEQFGSSNIWMLAKVSYSPTIVSINETATQSNIRIPSLSYWKELDKLVLTDAYALASVDTDFKDAWKEANGGLEFAASIEDLTPEMITRNGDTEKAKGCLDKFGYTKFFGKNDTEDVLWTHFDGYNKTLRASSTLDIDETMTSDYVTLYKNTMAQNIAKCTSCLAVDTGDYGSFGPNKLPAEIEGKKWKSWNGLLEFILVYPIGAFIDTLTKGFLKSGASNGGAQILAIIIVTMVVRGLMLLLTAKNTKSQAKMTQLQPQVAKIQAKYPNANTNQYEKQRMAMEMQKLYKDNGVKPFKSLLVTFLQFPIFIGVWGAISGSAYLASGSFLGLRLSDPIGPTIIVKANWTAAGGYSAITALVLYILMAAAQIVSMLLPQRMQKKAQKKTAQLGRNPAQKQQGGNMKFFTVFMLIMILVMGLFLASGLGVYWFIGAIFSLVQSIIMYKPKGKKAGK